MLGATTRRVDYLGGDQNAGATICGVSREPGVLIYLASSILKAISLKRKVDTIPRHSGACQHNGNCCSNTPNSVYFTPETSESQPSRSLAP